METRHPVVEGSFGSEFWAICNHCVTMTVCSDANTAVRAIGAIASVQTIVTVTIVIVTIVSIVLLADVVCRRAGHRAVGRLTLHGGPVVLRPVRAAPCCNYFFSSDI